MYLYKDTREKELCNQKEKMSPSLCVQLRAVAKAEVARIIRCKINVGFVSQVLMISLKRSHVDE